MDLSKLPRMSDTRKAESQRTRDHSEAPPEAAPEEQRVPFSAESVGVSRREHDHPLQHVPGRVVAVDAGSGAWISMIVAALLILFMPRFWQWLSHRAFGTSFAPFIDPVTGGMVPYTQTLAFWSDSAVALFALALLIEGLVLFFALKYRAALWSSLVIVAAATLLNLGFLFYAMTHNYGLQLFSTLAVLFGAFMCVQQWQLLHGPRRRYLLVEEG